MAIWGWWDKPIYDASDGSAWLWLYGVGGVNLSMMQVVGALGYGYMGLVG